MVTRLRMKGSSAEPATTTSETEEREARKARKKERQRVREERERRRLERERRHDHQRAAQAGPSSSAAWGFDESSVPPEQAYRRDDQVDEDTFEDKLQSAMEDDFGASYAADRMYEREAAAAFSYGGAAGVALGVNSDAVDPLTRLDDEEYAEWVRAGMWRRTKKDEIRRQEEAARLAQEREAKEAAERERTRRLEAKRRAQFDAQTRRDRERDRTLARRAYDDKWRRLQDDNSSSSSSSTTTTSALKQTDYPWPVFPTMPLPPLSWPSPSDLTPSSISSFLFSDVGAAERKATLRRAVLAYHPDRFERLVKRLPEEQEEQRERVRALGLRTSQVLNDLLRLSGSSSS